MGNKVFNLFPEIDQYSKIFNQFLEPFEPRFPEDFSVEEIYDFAVQAWNLGNMGAALPDDEYKEIVASETMPEPENSIFREMLEVKRKNFAQYDRFIVDFSFLGDAGEEKFTLSTLDKASYLNKIKESVEDSLLNNNLEEGYINRYAIVLRPKQPLFDWINALYPENPINEVDESSVYLVKETEDFFQDWLKKKYDRFFMAELEEWHTNKKQWPQKRSYKMFMEWFDVQVSTLVYDMEKQPVFKDL